MPPTATSRQFNNIHICHLLRCTPDELRELKNAFKSELQAQWAGGRPFLGQRPSESDPDGAIREELWTAVARNNPLLGRLLNGRRYPLGTLPAGFADGLRTVKDKIFRDLNDLVRKAPKRRVKKRDMSPLPVESGSSSEPAPSPQIPAARSRKRLRHGNPADHGAHDPEARQRHEGESEGGVPASLTRASRSPSIISLSDDEPNADAEAKSEQAEFERLARARGTTSTPVETATRPERPRMTLPGAIRQIEELEGRVSALEQSIQQQNSSVEDRVIHQVRSMLTERDRTIESLRWYLEGDA